VLPPVLPPLPELPPLPVVPPLPTIGFVVGSPSPQLGAKHATPRRETSAQREPLIVEVFMAR
jgi:hypothetical protein